GVGLVRILAVEACEREHREAVGGGRVDLRRERRRGQRRDGGEDERPVHHGSFRPAGGMRSISTGASARHQAAAAAAAAAGSRSFGTILSKVSLAVWWKSKYLDWSCDSPTSGTPVKMSGATSAPP